MAEQEKETKVIETPEIDFDESTAVKGPQNRKEEIYEKIRIPVPVLDAIIVVLVIALAVVILLGRGGQG